MASSPKAANDLLDEAQKRISASNKERERETIQIKAQTPIKGTSRMDGMTPSTVNTSHMYKDDISHLSSMSYDSSIDAVDREIPTDGNPSVCIGDVGCDTEIASPVANLALDFEVNSPSDEVIGCFNGINSEIIDSNNLGLDIEQDVLLHRNQLLEESREFFDADFRVDNETKNDNELNEDCSESHSTDIRTKYKAQQSIIESQREELKRYNGILKTYRTSIREKNDCLKSMEKEVTELKQRSDANSAEENTIQSTPRSTWEEATLSALQSELRTYQQIIASLTDENNAFRQKEISYLQKVQSLEKDVFDLKNNTNRPSEEEFRKLEKDLRLKTEFEGLILNTINGLEEKESENQVQIAELGHSILKAEKICGKLERENETLQKLLNTSREAVLNRSLENDSHLDDSFRVNASFRSADEDVNTIVQESLRNELKQSKNRESQLRKQLKDLCQNDDNKDNIMESLSESQQEAIVYLNGEVNDLRTQLEQERKKSKLQLETMMTVEDKLEVLEQENKLAAEETVVKEKLLETAWQDLSMKNGESACLRDEVAELEEQSGRAQKLEASLRNLEAEHEALKKAHAYVQSQPQTVNNAKARPSPSPSRTSAFEQDNLSEAEVTLMTIDVDHGNFNGVVENEVEISTEKRTSDHDTSLRKFSVLKKALKQSYEKKVKELKADLETKECEVGKLTVNLESQRLSFQKQQDELNQMEIRRIYNESEMSQELENLRTSVKDRDNTVSSLRQTINQIHDKSKEDGSSWTGVSDISNALIDGVGKSIEMFESISFGQGHEDGKEACQTLSSTSFG